MCFFVGHDRVFMKNRFDSRIESIVFFLRDSGKQQSCRQAVKNLPRVFISCQVNVDDFQLCQLMKFKDAGLDVMESKPCNLPRLFKAIDYRSPMFNNLSISVIHDITNSVIVQ